MCFIRSCIEFTLCLYFHIEHIFGGIWNYMCQCCCAFIIRIATYSYEEYVEGKKSRYGGAVEMDPILKLGTLQS